MADRHRNLPRRPHLTESLSQGESIASDLSDTQTVYNDETDPTQTNSGESGIPGTQKRATTWFLRRRFSTAWAQKRQTNDEDSSRGPLGLRLLHSAPQPLIDVVFVHGLRGGSTKTWRKGNDPRLFWPQHWLPMESDLSHASIHSFGYESDWGSTSPSILNVHDFGRALYEEIKASPLFRRREGRPIILIGHSMGGLVIKKAFNLANQDVHRDISDRIKCIIFLATPHRGSDYAATLNTILKVSGITGMASSRDYINDLAKGSASSQAINEDFTRYAGDLDIYSFYETLPTSLGVSSSLIVDRESAILGPGFRKEVARYLNASHRDICKFDSPEDPNYLALKNSLTFIVQGLLQDMLLSHEEQVQTQLKSIQSTLGMYSLPDETFERIQGSCQWIDEREDFKDWRDSPEEVDSGEDPSHSPSLYWVTAGPGAGKTVLAAHVIAQLKEFRLQVSYYYFHVGKKSSQSLASFLRSIALQMATSNAAVRDTIAKVPDDGSTLDLDDARAVWMRVFRNAVLQVPMCIPQYWVIDAMDECVKYGELFTFLKGIRFQFPLQIFITSRKLPDIQKILRQVEDCSVDIVEIPVQDTKKDIETFVRSRMELLPIDNEEERHQLACKIVSKSSASFLWARLVMDELEGVYGYESINAVLQGIPEGMMSYYQRTIAEMAQNKREKHIAKAILVWVVNAARPLSTVELSEALRLDINVRLPSAKTAIEGLCGQLVVVDQYTNLVSVVHTTAREFLISEDAGDFRIMKAEAHERLATTCLQLLMSPPMQPPRHRRLLHTRKEPPSSDLLGYAVLHASEHVNGGSAESDKTLVALDRLLSTTVLTWIEKLFAARGSQGLIRVARNIKAYLDRRAKYRSPLNRHVRNVDGWATDLSRLANKFGGALTAHTQAIYFLIPPFCPTETSIYRQFGRAPDGLVVSGSAINTSWDDCAATINFEDEDAVTANCENGSIAVGFESGSIWLHNHGSFQKERELKHDGPVDLLFLDPLGSFIASASARYLTLWDMSGNKIWTKRIKSKCILLSSSSDVIIGATVSGRAFTWSLATGDLLEEHRYPYQPLDPGSELQSDLVKAPFAASFGPGQELLALAYRSGPICIFELQSHSWIAWAMDEQVRQVAQLVFNPNPDVNLLLVAYDESDLAIFDSWSGTLVQFRESETHAILTSLACSADGRTFATVDVLGNLQIWDFESLALLYHVLTPSHSFRILSFSSDGFNLVDVVGKEMRIWSPSALVRKTFEEESSTSDQAAVLPVAEGQYRRFQSSKIRSMVAHENLPVVFAGTYNGDVIMQSTVDGSGPKTLYTHDAMVKCIAVRKDHVASGDINGTVKAQQLDATKRTQIKLRQFGFQTQVASAIHQLIFDDTGNHLLISTADADHVYEVSSGSLVGSLVSTSKERRARIWIAMSDSGHGSRFLLASGHTVTSYSPARFPEKADQGHITLDYCLNDGSAEMDIDHATLGLETNSLVLFIHKKNGHVTTSCVCSFQLPTSFSESKVALGPAFTLEPELCANFLGISRTSKRLIFLQPNSWICSIDADDFLNRQYTQHFFVPSEYVTNSNDVLPLQTVDDTFVFCMHDKLAWVKNGLKFEEFHKMAV